MPKVRHRQSSVVLPTFPRPSVHFCSCLVLVLQCKVFFFSHSRKTAKLGNGPRLFCDGVVTEGWPRRGDRTEAGPSTAASTPSITSGSGIRRLRRPPSPPRLPSPRSTVSTVRPSVEREREGRPPAARSSATPSSPASTATASWTSSRSPRTSRSSPSCGRTASVGGGRGS